jgi:hypothetical protein
VRGSWHLFYFLAGEGSQTMGHGRGSDCSVMAMMAISSDFKVR